MFNRRMVMSNGKWNNDTWCDIGIESRCRQNNEI